MSYRTIPAFIDSPQINYVIQLFLRDYFKVRVSETKHFRDRRYFSHTNTHFERYTY